MRVTAGKSAGDSRCWGRGWRPGVLTDVVGFFSSILTWAFRFLYTNSISFSASLPQINTTGHVSPRGCCSCRRESAHKGGCVLTSSPAHFSSFVQPPPQTPHVPGTCSAAARSSVMSKRTALAPRSPAIRACRDTQQRSRRGQTRSPSTPRPRPVTCLPRILHTPHLCTLPHITHARGRWG